MLFCFLPAVPRTWKYSPPPLRGRDIAGKALPIPPILKFLSVRVKTAEDIVDGAESHEEADIAGAGLFDFDVDVAIVIAQGRIVRMCGLHRH